MGAVTVGERGALLVETRAEKECAKCRETKPIAAFSLKKTRSNGGYGNVIYLRAHSYCKPCRAVRRRGSYERRKGQRADGRPASEGRIEQFTREEKDRWTANLNALIERVTGRKPVRGRRARSAWVRSGFSVPRLNITAERE